MGNYVVTQWWYSPGQKSSRASADPSVLFSFRVRRDALDRLKTENKNNYARAKWPKPSN